MFTMGPLRNNHRLPRAISIFLAVSTLAAQSDRPGKLTFESRCASCHGADGNGGEFAPGILIRLPARTDADITNVVRNGLPNRGMPPVAMTEPELTSLVAYL